MTREASATPGTKHLVLARLSMELRQSSTLPSIEVHYQLRWNMSVAIIDFRVDMGDRIEVKCNEGGS